MSLYFRIHFRAAYLNCFFPSLQELELPTDHPPQKHVLFLCTEFCYNHHLVEENSIQPGVGAEESSEYLSKIYHQKIQATTFNNSDSDNCLITTFDEQVCTNFKHVKQEN